MKYRCRCKKCKHRRNLHKHPDEYVRDIRCNSCGAINSFRIDTYRQNGKERKKQTCHCDALWYPHRKGSTPFCKQSKTPPTEQQWQQLYTQDRFYG